MPFEHVNLTVNHPKETAAVFVDLFDWHIRWEGAAMDGGYTVHVGDDKGYVALYAPEGKLQDQARRYLSIAGLNHIGIVVDDLAQAESRVNSAGYTVTSHHDYEPGKRFYFEGPENIEVEVVSYS